eukprot:gene5639-8961_t
MAADYWKSNASKALVSSQRLAQSQLDDKARGLSDDHLRQIRNYFIGKISDVARQCKLRQRVSATAIVYFRRFYLRNNFCQTDPHLVSVGCLYLASKAEESLIAAKYLVAYVKKKCPGWPYEIKHVLDMEMVIMEDLDFDLVVFTPYRPLSELIKDASLGDVLGQQAWALVNDSYRTDVAIMYPPHLVAIASVHLAASICKKDIVLWMARLNVDLEEVHVIVMELINMYEQQRTTISVDECSRLLEALGAAKPQLQLGMGSVAPRV